jgi:hypothetical protein
MVNPRSIDVTEAASLAIVRCRSGCQREIGMPAKMGGNVRRQARGAFEKTGRGCEGFPSAAARKSSSARKSLANHAATLRHE